MSEIYFTMAADVRGDDEPPWCVVCMALYKQAVIDSQAARIAEAENDGSGDRIWLTDAHVTKQPVIPAVMEAISPQFPMLGKVWLCWTHAPAIQVNPEKVAELQAQQRQEAMRQAALNPLGTAGIPPGLLRGDGHAR